MFSRRRMPLAALATVVAALAIANAAATIVASLFGRTPTFSLPLPLMRAPYARFLQI